MTKDLTTEQSFQRFLTNLNPTDKQRRRIEKTRDTIGAALVNDDRIFLTTQKLISFLTGSYSRRTIIRPIDDIDLPFRNGWQGLDRLLPAWPIAMTLRCGPLDQLAGDHVGPAVQPRVAQTGHDRPAVDHRRATMDTKLKHWNHMSVRSNPASCSRSRCTNMVSGNSTFSSAVRLRLISSSLYPFARLNA